MRQQNRIERTMSSVEVWREKATDMITARGTRKKKMNEKRPGRVRREPSIPSSYTYILLQSDSLSKREMHDSSPAVSFVAEA